MNRSRVVRGLGALTLIAPLLVGVLGAAAPPGAAAVAPVPNPEIADSCGVDVTLVLDASGSVSSSHAVEDVRNAADAMLDSLSNTGSSARVTQFASLAQQLAPSTLVDTASLTGNGALRRAINGYYNPQPPRPSNVNLYEYDGSGNPLSSANYKLNNAQIQYTNWDQSLDQAAQTTPDLVVYITDGDPTAFDFNHQGDPFDPGPPPDVAFRTDRSAESLAVTQDRSVQEANRIKINGTRMLAVGVGTALSNPDSQARLVQIAGPQVARDADIGSINSLNDIDVALVTNFEDLAQLMRTVVLQLCSPSLTIRKLAQSPSDASYLPASGWPMTVTPSVPGGNGFDWILPNTTPAISKTLNTDVNGFAQFQWEPDPAEADSAARIDETLLPGYTAGRPNDTDFRCELRNETGDVRVVEGDFANPAAPSIDLDPIGQEIVTCTVYNSFDYEPEIALDKVNTPTEVRGDLSPPAQVTSNYAVTNPGNTPLSNVKVVDDRCGPVVEVPPGGPNVGDVAPRNGLLDPGESWQFRCQHPVGVTRSSTAGGINVVNNADVTGTDPAGTVVTATASDDVDIFTPAVTLTKLVNGQKLVTVPAGQDVTYTYAATNIGNTPLGSVTLVDDTCANPVRGPDAPGNNDAVFDVGETWNYSCLSEDVGSSVINVASIEGIPLNPVTGSAFPNPNPSVTATDTAEVQVVNPEISLTKVATPNVVLLSPDNPIPPEPVTYTFTAQNTGDAPLNRPGAENGPPLATDPGWVTDPHCLEDTTYESGDTNGNDLLDPGETWQFTCPGAVTQPTLNVANITGQPSDAQGDPLPNIDPVSDNALAFVDVVRPGIEVTKTALRGVVLDPDAQPILGPDTPTPRQAEYVYQVTNTGNVPLSLSPDPPVDDICAPLVFVTGDTTNPGLLDPDEVWEYACVTTLERQQSNTPPVTGDESGLVTNTVTATGVPFFDGGLVPAKSVTDTDTAQVTVIEPGISITKVPSAQVVLADGDVTYTIVVQNTGDVGLDVIGPTDTKCGPLEFVGGDLDNNELLDGANSRGGQESWIYTCTRSIPLPTPPDTVDQNTAVVLATDPLGNVYADTDVAQVEVIDPAISLTKTVSDSLVPAGTVVQYDFAVTNVGQSPIAADDVLADIQLTDQSDPNAPSCALPTLVSKEGGNQDDFLDRDPPEVWNYACEAPINAPTSDVATVTGVGGTQFGFDVPVSDTANAFVDVFHPGIEVEKSAKPTVVVGSGQVTYTYRVRNTGDVPLSGVEARIADDTCSPVTYVSGDQDNDGLLDTVDSIFEDTLDETWIFTCSTEISQTTTNTVTVEGTPVDPGGVPLCGQPIELLRVLPPCDVDDQDRATVTVVDPGTIEITKRTQPGSSDSFGFNVGGQKFTLEDGETKTFTDLAPGPYSAVELTTSGWQLNSLECRDPSGGTSVDVDRGKAMINLGAGETVSCTFTNVESGAGPPGPPVPPNGGGGLPPTGAARLLGLLLALGALCVLTGSGIMARSRRRHLLA